jgi:integrase
LKTCASLFPECKRILAYIPTLKKRRKNVPYLTKSEITAIKTVLTDAASPLTLRDRAIGLIALETGLRCCDIAGLKLSSINWECDKIKVTQQKTNFPHEIPLPAHSGNAIYDYILNERPKSDAPEIFLREILPHVRLESRSLTRTAMLIAQAAGVRQNPGERRGFHLYRYHFATSMLENDIPDVVISKALGHTDPESIEPYFGGDFAHLKEYALSIEDYPVDLGVIL